MKVLKISNEGLLDVNELILMGCSSKNGESTIGKFGTGLKYAIAVLTRNNIDFTIYLGMNKVKITKEPIQIRNKSFEQISINYNKTSITTNLGVEWEVWQGVREFIANAKDEGGDFEITDGVDLKEGETTVVFDYDQIEDCLSHFDFEGWEEVGEGLFFKRLSEPRVAKVFKEGFLVYEAEEDSSFDYRIDSLKINEARVAEDRREVKRGIAKIMATFEKEDVEKIVENGETDLGYFSSDENLSEGWDKINYKEVSGGLCLSDAIKKSQAVAKGEDEINLYIRGNTFVSEDNLLTFTDQQDIFLQTGEDDSVEAFWDIDLNTNKIYIWNGGHGTKAIIEAIKYREANIYCKEHKLKSSLEAVLHFKNK